MVFTVVAFVLIATADEKKTIEFSANKTRGTVHFCQKYCNQTKKIAVKMG